MLSEVAQRTRQIAVMQSREIIRQSLIEIFRADLDKLCRVILSRRDIEAVRDIKVCSRRLLRQRDTVHTLAAQDRRDDCCDSTGAALDARKACDLVLIVNGDDLGRRTVESSKEASVDVRRSIVREVGRGAAELEQQLGSRRQCPRGLVTRRRYELIEKGLDLLGHAVRVELALHVLSQGRLREIGDTVLQIDDRGRRDREPSLRHDPEHADDIVGLVPQEHAPGGVRRTVVRRATDGQLCRLGEIILERQILLEPTVR